MDNADNLSKYVEWDVRNWSIALDFWLANSTKKLSECRVLEIGANFGGLSLWFASKGARVVSSDFQGGYGVRREAVELHKTSGLMSRIEHKAVHMLDIPYTEEFDVVVFKSVIGAMSDADSQKKAVGEMYKALKKGGELFFAENLVASPVHNFFRRMASRDADWRYITISEMNEFLAPFSEKKLRTIGFAGTFGRTEAQRNLLALGDRLVFERIVPEKWKYIVAGVAGK